MMLPKRFLILIASPILLLLAGCWEQHTDLRFEPDGSGRIEQTLILSDRMVVGAESDERTDSNLPLDEESLRDGIGDAVEILEINIEDLNDGARRIHWRGTFDSTENFLASDFARETLSLTVRREPDDRVSLVWRPVAFEDNSMDLSVEQQYGLLKGLYSRMAISLGDDREPIQWEFDLRDRDGLETSKRFLEETGGSAAETVDAAALGIDSDRFQESVREVRETRSSRSVEGTEDAGDFELTPSALVWKRVSQLSDSAAVEPDLTLDLDLEWSGEAPSAYYPVVFESAFDDTGRSLIPEAPSFEQNPSPVYGTRQWVRSSLRAPAPNARAVANITGYLPLVVAYDTVSATLDDARGAIGEESTGVAALDRINLKIVRIEGKELEMEADVGSQRFEEITVIDETGNRFNKTGHSASGFETWQLTFHFAEEIPEGAAIEFVIREEERVAEVPFAIDHLDLP